MLVGPLVGPPGVGSVGRSSVGRSTAIEIRRGPQGSPNEGAFEDGVALTVIGRKLQVGEQMPDMFLWQPDRYNSMPSLEPAKLPTRYLLYTVNGFLTPVCEQEAKNCQTLANSEDFTEGTPLYGLTSESLFDIKDWMIKMDFHSGVRQDTKFYQPITLMPG